VSKLILLAIVTAMKVWEIAFKIKYEYPFIEMSGRYHGARI
jgi:hypothetical protein